VSKPAITRALERGARVAAHDYVISGFSAADARSSCP
jgi:hypothetical protein